MTILLDENIDQGFAEFIPEHTVWHVVGLGWQGTKNGELLRRAAQAGVSLMITADKNMPYQQSIAGRPFPLLVLDIHPNTLPNQVACLPTIREILTNAQPGEVHKIEGPHPKRARPNL